MSVTRVGDNADIALYCAPTRGVISPLGSVCSAVGSTRVCSAGPQAARSARCHHQDMISASFSSSCPISCPPLHRTAAFLLPFCLFSNTQISTKITTLLIADVSPQSLRASTVPFPSFSTSQEHATLSTWFTARRKLTRGDRDRRRRAKANLRGDHGETDLFLSPSLIHFVWLRSTSF